MNLIFILYIKLFVLKFSYGDSMKIIWKNNSKLLIIVTILEIILSIYFFIATNNSFGHLFQNSTSLNIVTILLYIDFL